MFKIAIFWLKIMNFGRLPPAVRGDFFRQFLMTVLGTSRPNFSFVVIFSGSKANSSICKTFHEKKVMFSGIPNKPISAIKPTRRICYVILKCYKKIKR